MIVDRFTKFILSIIAFSLCLNALNPWLSPTLANANDDFAIERAIKKVAGELVRIGDNLGKMVEIAENQFEYSTMTKASVEKIQDEYFGVDDQGDRERGKQRMIKGMQREKAKREQANKN